MQTLNITSGIDWQCIDWRKLRTGDRIKILMQNGDSHTITVSLTRVNGAGYGDPGIIITRNGHEYYTNTITSILLDPSCRPKLPVDLGRMIKNVETTGRVEFDYGIRVEYSDSNSRQWRLFNADSLYGELYTDGEILRFTVNG